MDTALPRGVAQLVPPDAAPPATSTETYFVSLRTPHNVKVRGGAIEIKRLQRICGDGLELWAPTLHAPFPVDLPELGEICAAWGVERPDTTAGLRDPAALARMADALPDIRRVSLTKHRTRIHHIGCPGELVTIEVAGQHWMSVAFEHEDRSLVRGVLADLGIDPRLNLNYPTALKRLLARQRTSAHGIEGVPT